MTITPQSEDVIKSYRTTGSGRLDSSANISRLLKFSVRSRTAPSTRSWKSESATRLFLGTESRAHREATYMKNSSTGFRKREEHGRSRSKSLGQLRHYWRYAITAEMNRVERDSAPVRFAPRPPGHGNAIRAEVTA